MIPHPYAAHPPTTMPAKAPTPSMPHASSLLRQTRIHTLLRLRQQRRLPPLLLHEQAIPLPIRLAPRALLLHDPQLQLLLLRRRDRHRPRHLHQPLQDLLLGAMLHIDDLHPLVDARARGRGRAGGQRGEEDRHGRGAGGVGGAVHRHGDRRVVVLQPRQAVLEEAPWPEVPVVELAREVEVDALDVFGEDGGAGAEPDGEEPSFEVPHALYDADHLVFGSWPLVKVRDH